MYFIHDSWNQFYKEPFGAAPAGSSVFIRVRAGDVLNVRLHLNFRSNEQVLDMVRSEKDPEVWECELKMPCQTGLIWYHFSFDAFNNHYVYGTRPDGFGGEGQISQDAPQPYQITCYDANRKVPEWYSEGLMYQIFPDRFFKADTPGFTPEYPRRSMIHGRWDDTPHYFRKPDGSIEYWDFFGGNLAGITAKLDYLKSFGVTILYLNPIFEAGSNHKYDTADYRHISPDFGNEQIFKTLCREAKKRGIHVILDGVFNHTGDDSRYFNTYDHYDDLGAAQSKDSPYHSWYNFTHWPVSYESWWGVRSMPSMNKSDAGYQNFIFGADDSVVRSWLRAGASGWRLDVADELPDDFIVGIKAAMMAENPDSVLLGEVWEDASNKVAYGVPRNYFMGRELDSVMNYPFRECLLAFMTGAEDSAVINRRLTSLYDHYPRENFMANMNLIGSHDRARALTVLGSPPGNLTEEQKADYHLDESALRLARARLRLLVLVQMTYPGVPVIYYGDEAGMEGFEDPYNRAAFPWGQEDRELKDWFRKTAALRTEFDSLKKGTWEPLASPGDLLVYKRVWRDETIVVIINRNAYKSYEYSLKESVSAGRDLLTRRRLDPKNLILNPLEAKVILL